MLRINNYKNKPLELLFFFTCVLVLITLVGGISGIFSNDILRNTTYLCVFLFYLIIILYVLESNKIVALVNYRHYNFHLKWLIAFAVVAGNFLIYIYVTHERDLKYWDAMGYWRGTVNFRESILNNFNEAFPNLYNTVNKQEYSAVPCFFVAPMLDVAGNTYVGYIISIYNIFLLPFFLLCILLCWTILKDNGNFSHRLAIVSVLTVFLFPALLLPTLAGNLDAIGLLYVILILIMVYKDVFTQIKVINILLLSFMILMLCFSRRWYAYWAVSFYFSYLIVSVIRLFQKTYDRNTFFRVCLNLFFAGALPLIIMISLFRQFFERSVFNNYSTIYSAYLFGTPLDNIGFLFGFFGWLAILLAFIGFVYGMKHNTSRYFSYFLVIQLFIIFFMFIRIQSFGWQHYYLLAPNIAILTVFGVARIATLKIGKFILTGIAFLFVLQYGSSFVVQESKLIAAFNPLFPKTKYPSRVRADYDEMYSLIQYLKGISTEKNYQSIYVLASSHTINDDILRNIDFPKSYNAITGLLTDHSHIDKRDKFPPSFLAADIVVVADPVQYHLAPQDQKIVGVLAEKILAGEGIGKSYDLLKVFELKQDIKVKVYQRNRPLSVKAIKDLHDIFYNAYPDFAGMYAIDFLPGLIFDRKVTDAYSAIALYNNYHDVYIHPGDTAATSFKIFTDSAYQKVTFNCSFKDPEVIKNNCGDNGGEIFLNINIDGVTRESQYITYSENKFVELDIKGAKVIKIEIEKAKKGSACDGFIISNIALVP